jgi:hypothetical protein
MAEDPTPRQLLKQLPDATTRVVYDTDPVAYNNALSSSTNGWENIAVDFGGVPTAGIINRTYIDLAGYTQDELTTFVQGVDIQKSVTPMAAGTVVWEYDFISTRRLTVAELSDIQSEPGFLSSTLDLMELIYAEKKIWAENTTVPGTYITTNLATSGSGNPSAADRLHWTRLYVFILGTTTAGIWVGPTNLVVSAVTAREKDLVWIERLRRSYTQQRSET